MKNKLFGRLAFILPAMALLSGCQDKEFDMPQSREMIITAELVDETPDTRTSSELVEGGKTRVYWTPGDKIRIFSKTSSSVFTSQNTTPSRTAQFMGNISMVFGDDGESGNKEYIWGLYPNREDAEYEEVGGVSANALITTTLPTIQQGKEDSFSDNTFITIGRSEESLRIPFKGVCSGIYITFNGNTDITSVTLSGLDNEILAGRFTVGMEEDDNGSVTPYVESVVDPEYSVTVTAPGDGTFKRSKLYYIVTLPVKFQRGFMLTARNTSGKEGSCTIMPNNAPEFKMNAIGSVKGLDGRIDTWTTSEEIGLNEIWYRSQNNVKINYTTDDGSGNTVISNTMPYSGNGYVGRIRFANPLTTIDASAFAGQGELTTLYLPECVETIGASAFQNCWRLDYVEMKDNVKVIGKNAFRNTGVDYQYLSSRLETIDDGAFSLCPYLAEIDLPETVTEIGSGVFESSTAIEIFRGAFAVDDRHLVKDGRLLAFASGNIGKGYVDVVPEEVSVIDAHAYHGSDIEGVTLPETLTEIGPGAFAQCFSLKNITIPASVSKIHSWAFEEDEALEWIKIKRTESVIEAVPDPDTGDFGAFETTDDCPIYVPANTLNWYTYGQYWEEYGSKLGNGNRYRMSTLDSEILYTTTDGQPVDYTLPSGYTVAHILPEDNGGIGIMVLTSGTKWTEIPNNLFKNCSNLKSVILPETIERIGSSAFSGCSLESVSLPESLTFLGDYAFEKNPLITVTIPSSLYSMGYNPFRECTSLVSFTGDNEIVSPDGKYLALGGNELISYACAATTGVYELPASIRYIRQYAFNYAAFSGLKMLSLTPPSLYGNAFWNIDDYDLLIPGAAYVDYWQASAWDGLRGHFKPYQTNMEIWYSTESGDPVPDPTALSDGSQVAFDGFFSLVYSDDLTEIPANMFNYEDCHDIKTISLPDGIVTIGLYAFGQCWNLQSVSFGPNVEFISGGAFKSCDLRSLELPESVRTLGDRAFAENMHLTSVKIPAGLTSVTNNPFYRCKALQSFTGSSRLVSSDGHCLVRPNGELASFTPAATTGSYQVPEVVTSIGKESMQESTFTSLSFSSSLTKIGISALRNCDHLESVTIPASVTEIGNIAFNSCDVLTSITMLGITPPTLGSQVFYPGTGTVLPVGCMIHVPLAGFSAYKTAETWADYKDYIDYFE